jgi:hypothetical protein
MPFTLAHPAAVLPLRRFTALSFAGLVIGSMTPDLGHFLNDRSLSRYAHSFEGSLTFCVPAGLLLLWLFYVIRKPLILLLPEPHRTALLPLCRPVKHSLFVLAISVLIGAWTHNLWDSFTHRNGWFVEHYPVFQTLVRLPGDPGFEMMLYRAIQHFSTVVGLLALSLAYVLWLRRQTGNKRLFTATEVRLYLLWIALLLTPAVIAILYSGIFHGHSYGASEFQWITRSAVLYCTLLFFILTFLGIGFRMVYRSEKRT